MLLFPATFLAQVLPSALAGLEVRLQALNLPAMVSCGVVILTALTAWIRMLRLGAALRRASRADAAFIAAYQSSSHSMEIYQEGRTFENSPRHSIYVVSAREMAFHLLGTDTVDKNFALRLRAAGKIAPSQMDAVRRLQERTTAYAARLLASGARGAGLRLLPFAGVLGALLSLLEDLGRKVDGPALIGGALAPMTLALLLFLPLALWHHALVRRVREDVEDLADFAVELSTQFDRTFVDHRKPLESLPSLESMRPGDGPTFSLPPTDALRSLPVR